MRSHSAAQKTGIIIILILISFLYLIEGGKIVGKGIGGTVLCRNESIEPSPPDLQEGEGDADGKAELLVVW